MQKKKGISLIVLVITIIVMIILAASVVISLNNTGVIDRASQAVKLTDEKQVQDLAALIWAEAYLDENRTETLEKVVKDKLAEQGVTDENWNILITNEGLNITAKQKVITIPEGGTFASLVSEEPEEYKEYVAGEKLPEGYKIKNGDAYVEGDYTYIYLDETLNGVAPGWAVFGVEDKTKECYADIQSFVLDVPVVWLSETFANCLNLKKSPKLPATLVMMTNVFENCDSLTNEGMPILPNGLIHLSYSFMYCDGLTDLSNFNIPDTVINMWQTFEGCKQLKVAPKLPKNIEILNSTFSACSALEVAPQIPESATEMWSTFSSCTALKKATNIPRNATYIVGVYSGCTSLQGEIKIDSNPTDYFACFRDVDMSKITLTGESTMKQTLANEGENSNQVIITN